MSLRRTDIARGLIGGLLGAFAMRTALDRWHRRTGYDPRHGAFGLDREADVNSIRLLAGRLFGKDISDDDAFRIATQFHYAYGALGGAAYVVGAARYPSFGPAYPVAFAASVWMLADELPISALGISHPLRKSGFSHLAALIAHLLYSASIQAVCRRPEKIGRLRS